MADIFCIQAYISYAGLTHTARFMLESLTGILFCYGYFCFVLLFQPTSIKYRMKIRIWDTYNPWVLPDFYVSPQSGYLPSVIFQYNTGPLFLT